jgi:hypothetical protein
METFNKLKRSYQRFIQEWVACGSSTQAIRKLRPDTKRHRERAYALRQRPDILQAFAEYSAQFDKETEEQLHAAKRKIANAAIARRIGIVAPDRKTILPVEEWPEGVEDCVDGFELDPETGNILKIRLAPLTEARRLFLESQKALVRRNSLEDPNGRPLNPGVARLMIVTEEEAKKLDHELDTEV